MIDTGEFIKDMLENKYLNQIDLADFLNCSRQNINKMLKVNHKLGDIIKLADLLDYDISVTLKSRATDEEIPINFDTNE